MLLKPSKLLGLSPKYSNHQIAAEKNIQRSSFEKCISNQLEVEAEVMKYKGDVEKEQLSDYKRSHIVKNQKIRQNFTNIFTGFYFLLPRSSAGRYSLCKKE